MPTMMQTPNAPSNTHTNLKPPLTITKPALTPSYFVTFTSPLMKHTLSNPSTHAIFSLNDNPLLNRFHAYSNIYNVNE